MVGSVDQHAVIQVQVDLAGSDNPKLVDTALVWYQFPDPDHSEIIIIHVFHGGPAQPVRIQNHVYRRKTALLR